MSSSTVRFVALIAWMSVLPMIAHAADDWRVRSTSLAADYWFGVETDSTSLALNRFTVLADTRIDMPGRWQFDGALRLEYADAGTGLGSRDTYSRLSRPAVSGDARVEIDRTVVTWRRRGTVLTLGKQAIAWGVLDGIQVTDRFAATRRRDAVFSPQRPERLTRWGARLKFRRGDWRWDLAVTPDDTAGQFANPGDTFFPQAPRLRGGIPPGAALPPLTVRRSGQATWGVRTERTIGNGDFGVVAIHGPDTEPVFELDGTNVAVTYRERTLIGATWQHTSGERVWRMEAAYIDAQPVNALQSGLPVVVETGRWLAGAGLDWRTTSGIFINAQIGADYLTDASEALVRRELDVLTTLRAHKDFANDTLRISTEWLQSLTDGDTIVRPSLAWQATDRVSVSAGYDWIDGDPNGLLGQFEAASRVWLRFTLDF
ncbi:MAG: hypothetical protein AAGJ86_04595 [Pseudomonadota bacterium]